MSQRSVARGSGWTAHQDGPLLSVCCMTRDDPARVARSLVSFCDVECEFVIAVDDRIPRARLAPLMALSPCLYRFTFREPVDRVRPWLLSRCRGTWIFVVDGDEVVSPALQKRLPELLDDSDVEMYAISRRWTFPDLEHWLHETPWWPDFQVRLVRNRPDVPRLQGVLPHQGIRLVPPWRHILEPLYHLDPVLTPFADRVAKAQSYERQRSGLVAPGGGDQNRVFYLPEYHASARPMDVPHEDRERLYEVCRSGPGDQSDAAAEPGARSTAIERIPEAELQRHQPPWGATTAGCELELQVLDQDLRFDPGETRALVVRVDNVGAEVVPGGDDGAESFFLSYHLLDGAGGPVELEGVRTRIPASVAPGDDRVVEVFVRAPDRPGRYVVRLDAVHEHVRWFGLRAEAEIVVARRFDATGR
jgi:hypothetical protein